MYLAAKGIFLIHTFLQALPIDLAYYLSNYLTIYLSLSLTLPLWTSTLNSSTWSVVMNFNRKRALKRVQIELLITIYRIYDI